MTEEEKDEIVRQAELKYTINTIFNSTGGNRGVRVLSQPRFEWDNDNSNHHLRIITNGTTIGRVFLKREEEAPTWAEITGSLIKPTYKIF